MRQENRSDKMKYYPKQRNLESPRQSKAASIPSQNYLQHNNKSPHFHQTYTESELQQQQIELQQQYSQSSGSNFQINDNHQSDNSQLNHSSQQNEANDNNKTTQYQSSQANKHKQKLEAMFKKKQEILKKLNQENISTPQQYQKIIDKLISQGINLKSDLQLLREKVYMLKIKQLRKIKQKAKEQQTSKSHPQQQFQSLKVQLKKKYQQLQKLQKKSTKSNTKFALQIQYREFVNKLIQLQSQMESSKLKFKDEKKINRKLNKEIKLQNGKNFSSSKQIEQIEAWNKELKAKIFLLRRITNNQGQSEIQIHKYNIEMKERQKKVKDLIKYELQESEKIHPLSKQYAKSKDNTRLLRTQQHKNSQQELDQIQQKLKTRSRLSSLKFHTLNTKVRAKTQMLFQRDNPKRKSSNQSDLSIFMKKHTVTQIQNSGRFRTEDERPIIKRKIDLKFLNFDKQEINQLCYFLKLQADVIEQLSAQLQSKIQNLQQYVNPNHKRDGSKFIFAKQKDIIFTKNRILLQQIKKLYKIKIQALQEYSIIQKYCSSSLKDNGVVVNQLTQTYLSKQNYEVSNDEKYIQQAQNQRQINSGTFPNIGAFGKMQETSNRFVRSDMNRSQSEMKFTKRQNRKLTEQNSNGPSVSARKPVKTDIVKITNDISEMKNNLEQSKYRQLLIQHQQQVQRQFIRQEKAKQQIFQLQYLIHEKVKQQQLKQLKLMKQMEERKIKEQKKILQQLQKKEKQRLIKLEKKQKQKMMELQQQKQQKIKRREYRRTERQRKIQEEQQAKARIQYKDHDIQTQFSTRYTLKSKISQESQGQLKNLKAKQNPLPKEDFVGQLLVDQYDFDDRIYADIEEKMLINELTVYHSSKGIYTITAKYKPVNALAKINALNSPAHHVNGQYLEQKEDPEYFLETQLSFKLNHLNKQNLELISQGKLKVSKTQLSINDYVKHVKLFYNKSRGYISRMQVVSKFNVKYEYGNKQIAFPTSLTPYMNVTGPKDMIKSQSRQKSNQKDRQLKKQSLHNAKQKQDSSQLKYFLFEIKPQQYPSFMFGNYKQVEEGQLMLTGLGFLINKQQK